MSQRSFLRDISGVFGSNLLALVNAFLIDIVLSRQLGPEGRGLYTSILVVPLIVVSFALLGIRRSAVFHLGNKVFDENRTVSGVMSLLVISSVLAIVISGFALLFMMPKGLTWPMAVMALLSIPVKLILVYSGGIYIGKEEFKRSNLQVWLPMFYNLAGIILFVFFLKWSVLGALLSLFIANLLVSLVSLSYLKKHYAIRLRWDKEVIGSLAQLGIVYAFAVVVMQLNYRVDLLLLQKLSTLKEVGYYSLGVAISDKLWQLPSAIGLVVMSRSANTTDEQKLNRDVARLLRLSFLLVLFTAAVLWLIIPLVLPLLFGDRFIPSITIVRWMLPGILMFVIVRILTGRFAGKGQPLILISIFVPALILNILLNLIWIPSHGGVGAAWASNVSYSAGAIALLAVFSVKMKVSFRELVMIRATDFDFLRTLIKKTRKA
ncbi:MAG: oligosaccharide flippase family protein [Bacteroidetes bacterium]|nr:oligosaccharide flippase family protein [Bacteroidota bacterium]